MTVQSRTVTGQEPSMAALQPGAVAPDFTLSAHSGSSFSLATFRGRRTLVTFLPFAFTGG